MIHVDTVLLAVITGSVIPLVTGIVTKLSAPSGIKALCTAVLAGATGLGAFLTNAGGVSTWQTAVLVFFGAWVTSIATYYGLWRPTGVAPAIQQSTAGFGIGQRAAA